LFDLLAALAVRQARGSPRRLFRLVYAVGTVVTRVPVQRRDGSRSDSCVYAAPKPQGGAAAYLFICAFIANAASFVLADLNPANLVFFGNHMPPLLSWLGSLVCLPSSRSVRPTPPFT